MFATALTSTRTAGAANSQSDRAHETPTDNNLAPQLFQPSLVALEPRIVLNATAELSAAFGLTVLGDASDDEIRVEVVDGGTAIQLYDSSGIVAVSGHTGGTTGRETDPLAISQIPGRNVSIDLGAGDDVLKLELPDGIDLNVNGQTGFDRVEIDVIPASSPSPATNIRIESDQIDLSPSGGAIQFADRDIQFIGQVKLGSAFTSGATLIDIGNGSLTVDGQLYLDGSVRINGSNSDVDFSEATLSSTAPGASGPGAGLFIQLAPEFDTQVSLGVIDDSGGSNLGDLSVVSASLIQLLDETTIDGDLFLASESQISFAADIDAASIQFQSDLIQGNGTIGSNAGTVVLSANQMLDLTGNLDTSPASTSGNITLSGETVLLDGLSVSTSNANLEIIGSIEVTDSVAIDTRSTNAASPIAAGDVTLAGPVFSVSTSAIETQGSLQINASGITGGNVRINGDVGANTLGTTNDLGSLSISANQISLQSVGVSGGPIQLQADQTELVGSLIRTSEIAAVSNPSIEIAGDVLIATQSATLQSASNIEITGDVTTTVSTNDASMIAIGDISIGGSISDGNELRLDSGSQLILDGDISRWQSIELTGDSGVFLSSAQLSANDAIVIHDDISFSADASLRSSSIRLEGSILVAQDVTVQIESELLDATEQTELQKRGLGQLVIRQESVYSQNILVQAGTLRVDAELTNVAQLTVADQATLSSSSSVAGITKVLSGGRLTPMASFNGTGSAQSGFDILALDQGSIYEVDIRGPSLGGQHDSVLVSGDALPGNSVGSPLSIDGATLTLNLTATLQPDTEILIAENNTNADIEGRFLFDFDTNGNSIATSRTLEEGDLVFAEFGIGAAAPAFITYFGGDGNDVAIVTAGDRIQTVGNVTLVTRRGSDLEIRTGTSMTDAESNSPTVRPIAGLNGQTLTLNAIAPNAELFVDINNFVDSSANELHFDADIQFRADGVGGDANVVIFDSEISTIDSPVSVTVDFATANDQQISFNHSASVAPAYSLSAFGASTIDLQLPADRFEVSLSELDDLATFSNAARAGSSEMNLVSGGQASRLAFELPTETLVVNGQSGNDQIRFDSMDESFIAVPKIFGGDDQDSIEWNADVSVGIEDAPQTFQIDAESVEVQGNITLVGGGDITLQANSLLDVNSTLDSTEGQIRIQSNAFLSDLSESQLRSSATGDSIILAGRGFLLGNMTATNGNIVLGADDPVGNIGDVSQSAGSSIESLGLNAQSDGTLRLDSPFNQWDSINVSAAESATLFDSQGNLNATVTTGDRMEIRSAGNLRIGDLNSTGSDVQLFAAGDLLAGSTLSGNHVAGQTVELFSAAAFPGQTLTPGTVSNIGSALAPVTVEAFTSVSATSKGTGGSIFINGGALPIGLVDAGTGRIEITAETLDDDDSDPDPDLIAETVVLNAANGIGANATLTTSELSQLVAQTENGSIHIDVQADQTVTLDRIFTGGGIGSEILIQQSGLDRLSIGTVANLNGDVRLITESASIDVLDRTPQNSIVVGGTGELLVQNLAGNGDITVRGNITSESGDIEIAARRNIALTPSSMITSQDGHLTLSAGNRDAGRNAAIDLQDGSSIDAGVGTVQLTSPGHIFVSSIRSFATAEAILIESANGSLIDSGDQEIDLIADAGLVRIDVALGIGDSNPIETEIDRLDATSQREGAIQISEATEIELVNLVTHSGIIEVVSQGTLTATQVESRSFDEDVNSGENTADLDIHLATVLPESDLLIATVTALNGSDVHLISADDILSFNSESLISADDLSVTADNGTSDQTASQSAAIRIITNVNQLEAAVLGSSRGDLAVTEVDSIQLAGSDRHDDAETITTGNGEIRIDAGDTIFIVDAGGIDDGQTEANETSLRSDLEIIAGGDHGRIRLSAGQSLDLGDRTQLMAQQSTFGAVALSAPQVTIGVDFQIETGDAIGVARKFAPRPLAGLSETAFYDSTTVTTNRLEQASVNDATGILTVDIGTAGERGLTINLDWGAQTNRFQQIDSLSGDAPPLSVSHLYLEDDILSSTINGRSSSTQPLEVRFAVRHHESILIEGESIEQFESGLQSVAGEVISSTDNPSTNESIDAATLESGRAQFIIPALSIPVAFFPVRDVIPEFETDPVFSTTEQTVTLVGATIETTSATPSSSPTRDEYFQIRVRSPDPEGEDLVPPTRLPDDIIGGDKLKRLFESLPDGRYDIQYVLGDGNVRSILSVDLRDGKPTVPGDDLDGGIMRLREIVPETAPEDSSSTTPSESPDAQPNDPTESEAHDPTVTSNRHAPSAAPNIQQDGETQTTQSDYARLSVAGRLKSKGLEFQSVNSLSQPPALQSDETIGMKTFVEQRGKS